MPDLSSVAREAAEACVERIREHAGFAPEDAAWFVYGYVPGFTECASRLPSEEDIAVAICVAQGHTGDADCERDYDAARAVLTLIEEKISDG